MGSARRRALRTGGLAVLLVVAAAGAPPARAGDDDALRADLSALVSIAAGVSDRWEGPSPTLLVRRILDAKEKPVRALLEEAWKRAAAEHAPQAQHAAALERTIRFLWSVEGGAAPAKPDRDRISFGGTVGLLREEQGVVLVRPGGSGERGKVMGEPGWDRDDDRAPPPFAQLVKGGRWRKAARPDPRKVLDLLLGPGLDAWDESERRSLAMAAGEIAAPAEASVARLLERHEAEPADAWVATALAWAGTPPAVEAARRRVAPMAGRVAEGREAAIPILARACLALRRSAPEVLARECAALEGGTREAAYRGAGFPFAAAALLREHDGAADDAGRDAALVTLVRLLSADRFGHGLPAPADLPGVLRMLLRGLRSSDAQTREWSETGAYLMLYPGWRDGTANENMSSNGVSVEGTGARLGPYPDMSFVVPRLEEDLAAGRLTRTIGDIGLFDAPSPPIPWGPDHFDGAYSGIAPAIPFRAEAKPSSPVHLRAEPCERGLRFTLRNASLRPLSVNPVAFRYVCAEFMTMKLGGGPGDRRTFTRLKLSFGHLPGWEGWTVAADALVTLPPGGTFQWDTDVRPEHASADHVDVSLLSRMRVPAGSAAPLLDRFGDTWVR